MLSPRTSEQLNQDGYSQGVQQKHQIQHQLQQTQNHIEDQTQVPAHPLTMLNNQNNLPHNYYNYNNNFSNYTVSQNSLSNSSSFSIPGQPQQAYQLEQQQIPEDERYQQRPVYYFPSPAPQVSQHYQLPIQNGSVPPFIPQRLPQQTEYVYQYPINDFQLPPPSQHQHDQQTLHQTQPGKTELQKIPHQQIHLPSYNGTPTHLQAILPNNSNHPNGVQDDLPFPGTLEPQLRFNPHFYQRSQTYPIETDKKFKTKRLSSSSSTSSGTLGMTPETARRNRCNICQKQFKRPSSLQTHLYSHTGEKPFACTWKDCGRLFSVRSNMIRHRKLHERDTSKLSDGEDAPEERHIKITTVDDDGNENGLNNQINNRLNIYINEPNGLNNNEDNNNFEHGPLSNESKVDDGKRGSLVNGNTSSNEQHSQPKNSTNRDFQLAGWT